MVLHLSWSLGEQKCGKKVVGKGREKKKSLWEWEVNKNIVFPQSVKFERT
jgi:hypothetical protein